MKFTLVIFLCSFIDNQCLPPAEVKQSYNSWKECTIAAYELSKKLILLQEEKLINKNKLSTKFTCTEVNETQMIDKFCYNFFAKMDDMCEWVAKLFEPKPRKKK